jgi:hypothetical protein
MRQFRILAFIIPALALAGCFGEGDGPESIANAPVTPLPTLPPGFCDAINFEILCPPTPFENFAEGRTTVIDNPDKSGINTSDSVAQMQKFQNPAEFFGGTKHNLLEPIDFANGEVYKMKVWSSRLVPVTFKLEETGNPGGGRAIALDHTGSGMWEELCFDFTGQTATIPNPPVLAVTIIFDITQQGFADVDPDNWTFFYDDIEQDTTCVDEPDPFDSGLLTNGSFEEGASPWLSGVSDPINAGNIIEDDGVNVYFVDVTAAGDAFAVNLSQKVEIIPDETYTLTFRAKSDRARTMLAGIGLSDGDFSNESQSVDLTAEWQTFTLELTAAGFGDANSRVLFDMGAEVGQIFIDEVKLILGEPFDPGLLTNGDFEAGPSPWLSGVSDPINAANVIDDGGNNVYFVDVTSAGDAFAVNLSQKLEIIPDETYTLTFMAKSDRARTMLAGIGLSDGDFSNDSQTVNLTADWQSFTVQLSSAGFGDANSRVLFDMGAEVGQVFIDDVSLVVAGGGGGGGGGTGSFANGDFETGGFAGWTLTQVPSGVGSIALDTSMQGGRAGTVARLVAAGSAAQGNDVLISQEALAVAPGDSIDVSFDLYGSLAGAGGVVFVEVVFLNSAGEDEGGRNFVGPAAPYTPSATWTTYSGTVIAGTAVNGSQWDVSGGVTLLLKAACGPVDGCGVDASFDNVTFTIN